MIEDENVPVESTPVEPEVTPEEEEVAVPPVEEGEATSEAEL
jgi:hypothetical protein